MISGSSMATLVGAKKGVDVHQGLVDKFSVWGDFKKYSLREMEGVQWEPLALDLYLKEEQRRNAAVYAVSMKDCETFICPSFPLLCSEPDGLLTYTPAVAAAAATLPALRYTKLVEVKTLGKRKGPGHGLTELKLLPTHVAMQAAVHMLCIRVAAVDVVYYSKSSSPQQTKVFPMRWDSALQQRLIERDIPAAVDSYRRVWLPKFLDHRQRVLTGRATAAGAGADIRALV